MSDLYGVVSGHGHRGGKKEAQKERRIKIEQRLAAGTHFVTRPIEKILKTGTSLSISLKEEGILIFDSDMIKSFPDQIKRVYAIPAASLARDRFQNRIVTNMIMLGAMCSVTGVVGRKALESAIEDAVPKNKIGMNHEAFNLGFDNVTRFEI